jgi:hypothetical protein
MTFGKPVSDEFQQAHYETQFLETNWFVMKMVRIKKWRIMRHFIIIHSYDE